MSKFKSTNEFSSLVAQIRPAYLGTNDSGQKARDELHLDHPFCVSLLFVSFSCLFFLPLLLDFGFCKPALLKHTTLLSTAPCMLVACLSTR